MPEPSQEFTLRVEEVLRQSVTNTISMMFDIPVDVCKDLAQKLTNEKGYLCCGQFSQGNDARAKLVFSFDRELIKQLANHIFQAAEADNPAMYESTVTEIVNIVSNQLKVHLNLHGYKVALDIPFLLKESKTPAEEPLIHLAFSLKNDPAMGVDFYLRAG